MWGHYHSVDDWLSKEENDLSIHSLVISEIFVDHMIILAEYIYIDISKHFGVFQIRNHFSALPWAQEVIK